MTAVRHPNQDLCSECLRLSGIRKLFLQKLLQVWSVYVYIVKQRELHQDTATNDASKSAAGSTPVWPFLLALRFATS